MRGSPEAEHGPEAQKVQLTSTRLAEAVHVGVLHDVVAMVDGLGVRVVLDSFHERVVRHGRGREVAEGHVLAATRHGALCADVAWRARRELGRGGADTLGLHPGRVLQVVVDEVADLVVEAGELVDGAELCGARAALELGAGPVKPGALRAHERGRRRGSSGRRAC